MTKLNLRWVFAALSLLVCSPAWASHKSWVLKHGGTDCAFQSPRIHSFFGGQGGDIFLWNHEDYARTAVCPIAFAGRWGSSAATTTFGPARWAEAKRAWVHVYNGKPGSAITCQAVARLRVSLAPGGSLYYGTARAVTTEGYHTIELVSGADPLVPPWTDWGGSLETNEAARIRSVDFQCTLPGNGNYFSYIRGYGVAICQMHEGCYELGIRTDSPETQISIQGNGASCTSSSNGVYRGADGLTPTLNGSSRVVCPIVSPSQDSYEHGGGSLRRLRVYYSGTGSTGCEANNTCPRCNLVWEQVNNGSSKYSNTFVWNAGGYLEMPQTPNGTANPSSMSNWSTAAIVCNVPSHQRIRGYTGLASQTRVSQGQ